MLRPIFALLAVLSVASLSAPEGWAQTPRATPRRTPQSERAPRPPRDEAGPARGDAAATKAEPFTGPLPGQSLDKVVAIVGEGVVTQSELDEQIANISDQLKRRNTQMPPADVIRTQVLERLVIQELQLQRAERMSIKVTDEQLNAAVRDVAQQNNIPFEQLPTALAQQGQDYASFRDNLRKQITLQMVQTRELRTKINITPRELDQFIERMKKLPGENDEYDASHILIEIPGDATKAQEEELAKKAQSIYERAVAGEDFSQLAIANSNSRTALDGGELGWRKGPELPTQLAELIVSLKPGEVSKPMQVQGGFHIVKLNGMRSAEGDPVRDQVHVRHILIKPNTLQDDATVSLKLSGIRTRILNGEDFGVFASSMSEDTGSAVEGGMMDWTTPDTFVPEFAHAIDGLKENEISQPFRTEYGWHIVQLLGRRKFDTTEDNLRNRAYQQLRASKVDEETETWLRQMRDEAYVDTNL